LDRTAAETAIHRHTPLEPRFDLYMLPSLPFLTEPHILLAGNGGLLRLVYFLVDMREADLGFDFGLDLDLDLAFGFEQTIRQLDRAIVPSFIFL
jgi:hypothetical protein